MIWLPIAVGNLIAIAALVFALVVQRRKWQAEANALRFETMAKVAGARIRELAGELDDQRKRTRGQVAILEADIVDLERYIADTCVEDGTMSQFGVRYFASLQSLRDTARRLAADNAGVPGDETAGAPAERPSDQG